ncbi:glycosyltransferase [Myxococcota bacterium]|nr:glycosyltransferase [Myxococcota bacterium]
MAAGLTIAIPFYRDLHYLEQAVRSALDQLDGDFRLLVSDDGEREQGVDGLLESFGDSRISYHRNAAPLGMVRNWNQCLDLAETDLVTLLHADDQLLPGYTRLVRDLARDHEQAAAVCCSASIISASGRPRFSTADAVKRFFVPRSGDPVVLEGEAGLSAIMAGNFIMCPTLCFRRSVLGERRFADRWRQVQDLEFTSRLLFEGDELVYARAVEYAYRRHEAGATAQQSASMLRFDEELELFNLVADRAETRGWLRAAQISRRKRIVRLHLAYRALGALLRGKPVTALGLLRYGRGEARPGHQGLPPV